MKVMKCFVCSLNKDEFLCANCTKHSLLKTKLSYFDLLSTTDELKKQIDEILQNCIKNENYNYIKRYIQLTQNGDETQGSVAALSNQLLTIDSLVLKRRCNKISKEVECLNKLKIGKKTKIDELTKLINIKKQKLNERTVKLNDKTRINKFKDSIKLIKEDQLKIQKQLNISKSLLFQELLTLSNLKRKKLSIKTNSNSNSSISPTQKFIYILNFIPIISIWNILELNIEIINSSLQNLCKFLYQISNIFQISLPFNIIFNKTSPIIGNFEITLKKELWEISTFELRIFINGFTRIIYNTLIILQNLKQLNGITTHNYLKLDELVYKLSNNSNETGESIDLKKDVNIDKMTDLCLRLVVERMNKKNNEWQVVKKEMLEFE